MTEGEFITQVQTLPPRKKYIMYIPPYVMCVVDTSALSCQCYARRKVQPRCICATGDRRVELKAGDWFAGKSQLDQERREAAAVISLARDLRPTRAHQRGFRRSFFGPSSAGRGECDWATGQASKPLPELRFRLVVVRT